MKKLGFIACMFLLGGAGSLWGQVQDAILWAGGSASFKYNKNWSFFGEDQFRLGNNYSALQSHLTELGVKRRLTKHLDVAGGARYTYRPGQNSQRLFLDFMYGRDVKDLRMKVDGRLRLQEDFEVGTPYEYTVRPKIKFTYNIKNLPLNPYVSVEGFYHIQVESRTWDRMRYQVGLDWDYSKHLGFKLGYARQSYFNQGPREIQNIAVAGVSLSFERKKKKKKESEGPKEPTAE